MRNKTAVVAKLENLSNAMVTLDYMVNRGTSREQMEDWFSKVKEKIEEIRVLVNSENEQVEGSW